ncbi:MAG: hypothetical protein ACRC41_07200 [Sarcina sp.]
MQTLGVKKDWMYNFNSILTLGMTIGGIAGVVGLVVGKFLSPDILEIIITLHYKLFKILLVFTAIYPLFILKNIFPQMGSDKSYMSTSMLPYSRKELFKMTLQKYFFRFSLGIIGIGLLNAFMYRGKDAISIAIIENLGTFIIILPFTMILFFQVFAGIILCKVRKFKAGKAVLIIIFLDIILGGIISIIGHIVGKVFMDGMGALLIIFPVLFIPSFIMFLMFWNDIEKIYD